MNDVSRSRLKNISENVAVGAALLGAVALVGAKLSHDGQITDKAEKKLLTESNILANKYSDKLTSEQKIVALESCARDLYIACEDKHGMSDAFISEPEVLGMTLSLRDKLPEYKNKANDDMSKFQYDYIKSLSSFMQSDASIEAKRATFNIVKEVAQNGVVKTLEKEGVSYSGFAEPNKNAKAGEKPLNFVVTSVQNSR